MIQLLPGALGVEREGEKCQFRQAANFYLMFPGRNLLNAVNANHQGSG